MDADPLYTFFSPAEADDPDVLYTTLGVSRASPAAEIAKAYRRAALRCHPDKHASAPQAARDALTAQFQRVGFAFAVLSDAARRKRYDATGRTDEVAFGDGDGGWDAYFADLFDGVDRKALDEDKRVYQGSAEEMADVREAYDETGGDLEGIMARIPHSTLEDEARLVDAVKGEIAAGRLKLTRTWTRTAGDKAAAKKRMRAALAEAAEAEEEAKRLGVWDEFYGSGAKGKRARDEGEEGEEGGKAKGKGKPSKDGEDEDGALAALIRGRQNSRAANFAALEAKYAAKAKKGRKKAEEPHPDELDDDAFAALQAKMFANKDKGKKRKTK
ncbi:DnaJ-domain-containing protein [Cutaneotrichosporon oleaginosum]|uniref:DnaJ-domain-containing protein n=1 Tax=Cutaneotrichosporon oleaginosum TaxID=879819 RepID=A0A0J0XG74_9TREE|nr:DnaJ-domain-containing protein [Cutaneotrichosporon oleaginosum]KLT40080.1 DnaJ-domain-containing protein [Cutaneotrichosporon oleaginosum]TXT10414.1 hypothetical protein COLE_04348 [Cutaneotrichosporon oleaginosum]